MKDWGVFGASAFCKAKVFCAPPERGCPLVVLVGGASEREYWHPHELHLKSTFGSRYCQIHWSHLAFGQSTPTLPPFAAPLALFCFRCSVSHAAELVGFTHCQPIALESLRDFCGVPWSAETHAQGRDDRSSNARVPATEPPFVAMPARLRRDEGLSLQ